MLRADEHVAHCLVGAPRALIAPCAQRALVANFIDSFAPARSYIFAAFSIAKRNTELFNATHANPLEDAGAQPGELDAVAQSIGAIEVRIDVMLPTPSCHDEHVARSRAYSVPAIMMGNVRRCFQSVTGYEVRHDMRFDYVTRVRPDAIFFSRFVLPPRNVLSQRLVIPIGGLGGVCHRCANDHLALSPRHLASQYFDEISRRIDDCATGVRFVAQHWNPWEALAKPSGVGLTEIELRELRHNATVLARRGDVGYNEHVGIGATLAAVGLRWHAVPWPYALASRHCCPFAEGASGSCSYRGAAASCNSAQAASKSCVGSHAMQPIAELARACMEPLSCERLGFPLGAMKSGGVGHNLTHYLPLQAQLLTLCRAWRCNTRET